MALKIWLLLFIYTFSIVVDIPVATKPSECTKLVLWKKARQTLKVPDRWATTNLILDLSNEMLCISQSQGAAKLWVGKFLVLHKH